jgi:multidrug efflux pump subunit AcrB
MEIEEDRASSRTFRLRMVVGLMAVLLVLAVALHVFYRPLDVIWQLVMRQLGI